MSALPRHCGSAYFRFSTREKDKRYIFIICLFHIQNQLIAIFCTSFFPKVPKKAGQPSFSALDSPQQIYHKRERQRAPALGPRLGKRGNPTGYEWIGPARPEQTMRTTSRAKAALAASDICPSLSGTEAAAPETVDTSTTPRSDTMHGKALIF